MKRKNPFRPTVKKNFSQLTTPNFDKFAVMSDINTTFPEDSFIIKHILGKRTAPRQTVDAPTELGLTDDSIYGTTMKLQFSKMFFGLADDDEEGLGGVDEIVEQENQSIIEQEKIDREDVTQIKNNIKKSLTFIASKLEAEDIEDVDIEKFSKWLYLKAFVIEFSAKIVKWHKIFKELFDRNPALIANKYTSKFGELVNILKNKTDIEAINNINAKINVNLEHIKESVIEKMENGIEILNVKNADDKNETSKTYIYQSTVNFYKKIIQLLENTDTSNDNLITENTISFFEILQEEEIRKALMMGRINSLANFSDSVGTTVREKWEILADAHQNIHCCREDIDTEIEDVVGEINDILGYINIEATSTRDKEMKRYLYNAYTHITEKISDIIHRELSPRFKDYKIRLQSHKEITMLVNFYDRLVTYINKKDELSINEKKQYIQWFLSIFDPFLEILKRNPDWNPSKEQKKDSDKNKDNNNKDEESPNYDERSKDNKLVKSIKAILRYINNNTDSLKLENGWEKKVIVDWGKETGDEEQDDNQNITAQEISEMGYDTSLSEEFEADFFTSDTNYQEFFTHGMMLANHAFSTGERGNNINSPIGIIAFLFEMLTPESDLTDIYRSAIDAETNNKKYVQNKNTVITRTLNQLETNRY